MKHTVIGLLSLCILLNGHKSQAQSPSDFYNLKGNGSDESDLAKDFSIFRISLYNVVESDTCLIERIRFSNKGKLIMRTQYDCQSEEYNMTYKEEFAYDSNDSLIWESFLSVHNGTNYYHFVSHTFTPDANGLRKTSVTRDDKGIWDSVITLYSQEGHISETIRYPFARLNNRTNTNFIYDNELLVQSRSKDDMRSYQYKEGRLTELHSVGISGIYDHTVTYNYNRKGQLQQIEHDFPIRNKTEFRFNNGFLSERSFYEIRDDKDKFEKIRTVSYTYRDKLPVLMQIKDADDGRDYTIMISYEFNTNEIVIISE